MAKLEGVKVIDMQGGEITKIAYGGEEYAKVDENKAVKGDIIQLTAPRIDMTVGSYYKAESSTTESWFAEFRDDKGDINVPHKYKTFRKVSEPTTGERLDELETRVNALEAKEPSKEFDKPAEKPSIKVGDYAKVIGETYCNDITEGAIVEVTQEADCDGDYRIDLIDGSDFDFAKTEALEKIELSEADLVFIENGREPGEYKDGDIVEIIANTNYSANEVGDIGVVEYISAARTPLVNVRGRRQGRGTNHTAISDMKIIAFVESRVDIDA